jgi:catechol 2,3-dioxygenase-like lactoylglutathione lyase family enzyme
MASSSSRVGQERQESNVSKEVSPPVPRLTVITLGVNDMSASIAFYEALGFARKFRATGEIVAFFDTGGSVLGLFPWGELAKDVTLPEDPRPLAFRGMTLAWNCRTTEEVDAVLDFAHSKGASLIKPAHRTDYGGYSGYFADLDGLGKSWSRQALKWARTDAFTCRTERPPDSTRFISVQWITGIARGSRLRRWRRLRTIPA